MPVRDRVTTAIAEEVVGGQVWNGLTGECKTMPTKAWNETRQIAEVLYERIVGRIDWPRVILEASARHYDLNDRGQHKPLRYNAHEDLCGDCVHQALLNDDHWPRIAEMPTCDTGQDWLSIMAKLREEHGR